jgi:hypothetical protein
MFSHVTVILIFKTVPKICILKYQQKKVNGLLFPAVKLAVNQSQPFQNKKCPRIPPQRRLGTRIGQDIRQTKKAYEKGRF